MKKLITEIKELHHAIKTIESLKGSMIEYCANEFIRNDNSPQTAKDINKFFDDGAFAFIVKANVEFSRISFCVYEKAKGKDASAYTTLLYYSNFDKADDFTCIINRRLEKLHKNLEYKLKQLEEKCN